MFSKFLQLAVLLALASVLGALSCSTNQYYVGDQYCVNCPSNCSTCSNSDFCTSCQPNYFLVKSNFNATCQTCAMIFVGCQTCLSNVACTKCNVGYFVNNYGCTLCSSRTIFCIDCSADGNTCYQCAYPFILVKGLCISATVNSVVGAPSTNPISQPDTTPVNTTTTTTYVTLANGTQVPAVLDANGCNQLQVFYYNRCIKSISGCTLYQSNGLCQFCTKGYLVTIFGDCSPSNRILNCEKGYWHNVELDICVKVSAACDWYFDNGTCYNCSTGYAWNDTVKNCVQSVVCNSRQFFFSGTCITVPSQCITFSSIDGSCTSCETGYTLNSGFCTASKSVAPAKNNCTSYCNTCSSSNTDFCYSCIFGYELLGARYGTCVFIK